MSNAPNPTDTPEEHRTRMAKAKAIQDAEVASKKIRRGVVVVGCRPGERRVLV